MPALLKDASCAFQQFSVCQNLAAFEISGYTAFFLPCDLTYSARRAVQESLEAAWQ
jgi:hypothetical protein